MSSALYRLGRAAYARRRAVIGAWFALLALVGALAGLLGGQLDNSVTIPGTESQAALDRLAATFPEAAGTTAQVLVVGEDGAQVDDPQVVAAVDDAIEAFTDVDVVTNEYAVRFRGRCGQRLTPSCSHIVAMSPIPRCSTIRPSRTRSTCITVKATSLPVAATPISSPSWRPR